MDKYDVTRQMKGVLEDMAERFKNLARRLDVEGASLDKAEKRLFRMGLAELMENHVDEFKYFIVIGDTSSAHKTLDMLHQLTEFVE